MTFQELLAEVKKLSHAEKVQVVSVLNDALDADAIQEILTDSPVYDISTPIFSGSLTPLLALLAHGKQTGDLE